MANPWSPPGWMKANGQMSNVNGAGTLLSSSYAPLANYFVKFLQAYAAQGVNIYAITPQNEPGYSGSYPTMNFSEANEAAFVANNLGPALNQAGLHPVVLGVDVGQGSGKCLDDRGNPANGIQQYIWTCTTGNANQQYTYTSALQLQIAGKCLGAAGNGTTNGTQVITYTCNSTPSQVWNLNSDGTVTNGLSGLCLDVNGKKWTRR
jgi:O-glycosyl hydrolase